MQGPEAAGSCVNGEVQALTLWKFKYCIVSLIGGNFTVEFLFWSFSGIIVHFAVIFSQNELNGCHFVLMSYNLRVRFENNVQRPTHMDPKKMRGLSITSS